MEQDLEFSDYVRELTRREAMMTPLFLMALVTFDWLIIRGIVHAVRAICR
jgi:hypothetical protein